MLDKREILLQLRKNSSIRKVSRDLGVHRDVIRPIYNAACKYGWTNQSTPMPDNGEIERVLCSKPSKLHRLDPFAQDIKQWREDGLTAVVIQRLLQEKHQCACGIGSLRKYAKKLCPVLPDPVMVRFTKPGEIMDVDFGFLGMLWDGHLQKFRKAWVFSGRLRHSRKAYRRLVWEQNVRNFVKCHILAFEHFNGVVACVCLDNLKAGVIKSTIDNDMLNRSYKDLAEHYGFMISPCVPYTPEHKGGVESDIKYIKGNFWPEIRQKQKSCPKITLREAQEALEKWDLEVANVRKVRTTGRSPDEVFSYEEKDNLQPLPECRFEPTEWFQCIVRKEWWVIHEGSYYSVPYKFIGKTVQVRVTTDFMKIFSDHDEVACHPRAKTKGTYQRSPDHAPPYKEEVLNCNRQGLLFKATELGTQVQQFCEKMLFDRHVDKLRAARHLLHLAEKYGADRLNKACERALAFDTIQYHSVKIILEKRLDEEAIHLPQPKLTVTQFKYARNPEEYRTDDCMEEAFEAFERRNHG